MELTESGTHSRHVDFKVNTKAAGFPYRYSMIINQINCDLPISPDKGIITSERQWVSTQSYNVSYVICSTDWMFPVLQQPIWCDQEFQF